MELIVTLCYIFYILTNHSFNKIGILMNEDLDRQLNLEEGSNSTAVATSTVIAALGKSIGSFFEIVPVRYILPFLFLANGLCMYLALNVNNFAVFAVARNLQGFISGLQTSVIIGFISLLKDNKKGFANFTGVSALTSLFTSILLEFTTIRKISSLLLILNLIPSIVIFIELKNFKQNYKTVPIVWGNILSALKNISYIIYAVILGSILAIGLFITQKQLRIIEDIFPHVKYKFVITSMTFVFASLASLFYKLQTKQIAITVSAVGLIFYSIGVSWHNVFLTLLGCSSSFVCFALINPLVCHNVTKITPDKFVNSSFFFAVRSAITALVWQILSKTSIPILDLVRNGLLIILFLLLGLTFWEYNHESNGG